MKRSIRIESDGIELLVTIEGIAPCDLLRVIAHEVRGVAFDFVSNVTVTDEVWAEEVDAEDLGDDLRDLEKQ